VVPHPSWEEHKDKEKQTIFATRKRILDVKEMEKYRVTNRESEE